MNFQNRSLIDFDDHITESEAQKTLFVHKANSTQPFPYTVTAIVDNQSKF